MYQSTLTMPSKHLINLHRYQQNLKMENSGGQMIDLSYSWLY